MSDIYEIDSRLVVLCRDLLKWQFQPNRRSSSWRASIIGARNGIARAIRNSPSLKNYPDNVLEDAYATGRRQAEAEPGLTKLPAECPWSIQQMLKHDFWPGR